MYIFVDFFYSSEISRVNPKKENERVRGHTMWEVHFFSSFFFSFSIFFFFFYWEITKMMIQYMVAFLVFLITQYAFYSSIKAPPPPMWDELFIAGGVSYGEAFTLSPSNISKEKKIFANVFTFFLKVSYTTIGQCNHRWWSLWIHKEMDHQF